MVLSIYEDNLGRLWFGTHSGLSCWDGVEFENHLIPSSLSSNNCKWLTGTNEGTLYIATREDLTQYKHDEFSRIPGTPVSFEEGISYIMMSNQDILYIATVNDGLWAYDGQQFDHVFNPDNSDKKEIFTITEDKNEKIYFAGSNNKIYSLTEERIEEVDLEFPIQDLNFTCMAFDKYGQLWEGTESHGVFVIDKDSIVQHLNKLPSKRINNIFIDDEDIYISTDNGIAVFKGDKTVTLINDKKGLSNNFVWQIFKDKWEQYYIATDGGGVDIFEPGIFETYNKECGLPNNTVWAIEESHDRKMYFATDEGVAVLNGENISTLNGLSDNMVICIYEASDGKIYFGTNFNGIDVLDNGNITNINKEQGLYGPSIYTIIEDDNGLMYFGTYDGGVNIWDGKSVIDTLNVEDGLTSQNIVSSYKNRDGYLYFGTDGGGVFRYSNGHIDTTFLNGNTVWSICEDYNSNLYFATDVAGLITIRNGVMDTLDISDGLSHNSVLGIMPEKENILYLTLDNGMNRVDFNSQIPIVQRINHKDGLASDECNMGAYYKDSHGNMWIGTIAGVSHFNPNLYLTPKIPPRIFLSRFRIFDEDISLKQDEIKKLKYDENYLKFEFTGIDLSAPNKLKYRYALSGTDKGWVETKQRYVQYTNLTHGEHIFQVQAGNEWGQWSKPLKYTFDIEKPFWKTVWFVALVILIILSGTVFPIFYRIRHLLALERLRSKIAADLHDNIGAGLSEINILNAVMEFKIPENIREETKNERDKIVHKVNELTNSMSNIVWLVNPKNDSVYDLISRLSDSFSELLDKTDIRFNSSNLEQLRKIHLKTDFRQHLLLMFKEAINNSVKYSEAKNINLSVKINKGKYRISVKDDGKGFDSRTVKQGNGLKNIQERAQKIKGQVEIISKQGKGTEVVFIGKY